MGTSYSDSLNANTYGRSNFYDSIMACLDSARTTVRKLAILNLSTPVAPDDNHHRSDVWSSDSLLVYNGAPIAAIAVYVEGSANNSGVRQIAGKAMAAYSNATRAVADIRGGMHERLAAAVQSKEEEAKPTPAEPARIMTELAWRITIRVPNGPEIGATGGPFDFPQLEGAFDSITEIIEKAIAAAPAPAPAKVD